MLLSLSGSSPRIRGKLRSADLALLESGLIPAHTGKTRRETPCCCRYRAHPRAYGENRQAGVPGSGAFGSSPRIRGKLLPADDVVVVTGLIPAHTGKTVIGVTAWMTLRAHPRAYGENQGEEYKDICAWGSSPRIRGKLNSAPVQNTPTGLIPAHTGKTCAHRECKSLRRAHPRAYGENTVRVRSGIG